MAGVASIQMHEPRGADWAVCRALLPEAAAGADSQAWLALDAASGRVAGAALYRLGSSEIMGVRVRVVRDRRRQGVGRQLLGRIAQVAVERGLHALHGWAELSREPEAEPFARAVGFARDLTVREIEGDLVLLRDYMRGVRDRLARGGRIPPEARFLPLTPPDHEAVARLYADQVAHTLHFDASQLRPLLASGKLEHSTVLKVGGTVEGILLCQCNEQSTAVTVHARVVTRPYRGGWANCMLMLLSTERAVNAGALRVRFDVPGDNADTAKLAARCRGETQRELGWFSLPVRREEDARHVDL